MRYLVIDPSPRHEGGDGPHVSRRIEVPWHGPDEAAAESCEGAREPLVRRPIERQEVAMDRSGPASGEEARIEQHPEALREVTVVEPFLVPGFVNAQAVREVAGQDQEDLDAGEPRILR